MGDLYLRLTSAWRRDDRSVPREVRISHLLGAIRGPASRVLFGELTEWTQHLERRIARLENHSAPQD